MLNMYFNSDIDNFSHKSPDLLEEKLGLCVFNLIHVLIEFFQKLVS